MRIQEYIVARRQPEIVKHILYIGASFAAGALAMYFFDRMSATKLERTLATPRSSDDQLRERVRTRLGHLVSHPRAIEVEVNDGIVRLSGQVLAKEIDGLLMRLTGIAGVRKVHNALSTLTDPSGFGQPTGTISGAREQMAH